MTATTSEIPRSAFGKRSTAEEVTAGIDLTGKTALVTGCTSGIGLETMRVLAMRGAHVLAVGRTQAKAAAAIAAIRSPVIKGPMTPLGCEHGDFSSVVACADTVRALNLPLDIVICNAGIVGASTLEQVDGIEKQFAVNHLSHFILVNRLLDLVKAAPQGRIVMVSSEAHKSAPKAGIEFDNLAGTRAYGTFKMYGQSKLANHLMTRELAKRLAGSNATVNSIHPGVVKTNIFNNMTGFTRWLLDTIGGLFMKTVEAGAATMCYVATSPALAKVNGGYFSHCNPAPTTANAQSDTLAAKLWTVSEDMTRKYL